MLCLPTSYGLCVCSLRLWFCFVYVDFPGVCYLLLDDFGRFTLFCSRLRLFCGCLL